MTQTPPRPLGPPVPDWSPPPAPGDLILSHPFAQVVVLEPEAHAAQLFAAYSGHDWIWDYMPYGPFHSAAAYHRWMKEAASGPDPRFFAFIDPVDNKPFGLGSFLRIAPDQGSIEVGHICVAPNGQRSRAFTAAMYLMMQWVFDAGYRRYEWKCNALNSASRRAAQRLGFSYEGIFRQAAVVKGRNRDTAWFAMIDQEWPALRAAFETWLDPSNFDASGNQIERLSDLTRLVRPGFDPTL